MGNTLNHAFFANLIGGMLALGLAMLLNMRVRGPSFYRTQFLIRR